MRGTSGFRVGTGDIQAPADPHRGCDRLRADQTVVAVVQKFGLQFWRTSTWDPVEWRVWRAAVHLGHAVFVGAALLLATPIAIGIAVFITELCHAATPSPLVFLTELLAAIPSIVYGLWGIFVLVPAVRAFQLALPDALRQLPIFSGPPLGVGVVCHADSCGDGRALHRPSRVKC